MIMKHRWTVINVTGPAIQQCTHCGVQRIKESTKQLIAITPTPPYYHYKYTSVWAYIYDGKKTLYRPECMTEKVAAI